MDPSEFHHPAVRDLAWLMASPSLVAGGGRAAHCVPDAWCQRLYVARLDWLAALDREPGPVVAWLDRHRQDDRIGPYAEILLAFWLEHWSGADGVPRSLQGRSSRRTLGEFDLLWGDRRERVIRHWELAVKFYLRSAASAAPEVWIGPNPDDHLHAKLEVVFARQLQLARRPEAQLVLKRRFPRYDPLRVRAQAFLKGYLFYPASEWPEPLHLPRGLSDQHAMGWWLPAARSADLPQRGRDSRYVDLPKEEWLAPAVRPRGAPVLAQREMVDHLRSHFRSHLHALLIAELRPGLDGRWHERSRGFVVHDAWPNYAGPKAVRAGLGG
jgi:hypothetical protein